MCSSGGGGDGGAGQRKAAEDKRIAAAVKSINESVGQEGAKANEVDRSAFNIAAQYDQDGTEITPASFDQAGYDAAVASEEASAQKSRDKFAERNASYGTVKQDAINHAMTDLNKERGLTERDATFMLARQGLSGGSRDIDVNKDILDTFQQGVLKAGSMGSAVATNARSADEGTRMKLIDSVRNGLDAGTATGNAYTEMQNNSAKARDDAATQSLAGFFNVLANRFKQNAYDNGVQSQTNQTIRNGGGPTPDNGTIR